MNTIIVPDEALYRDDPPSIGQATPDGQGAIGAVFNTDILSIVLRGADGIGAHGVLDTGADGQPAAKAAITSFGEFLRVAAAVYLDVDSSEFRIGTQKFRAPNCVTEQLFLADTLENGAGYARRIYDQVRLRELVLNHYEAVKTNWTSAGHLDCDRSCPDCLRNYGNRFIHGLLDWRLALDMAELFLGLPLDLDRWLGRAEAEARGFAHLCQATGLDVEVVKAGELWAIAASTGKSLIIGHPLWHHREGLAQDPQVNAKLALQDKNGHTSIRYVDVRELAANPQVYVVELGNVG
jgi:DEAD/DEAH box helicase domain-containing protein